MDSSSSTRFVKVRFDNKAGIQVKVIPSKGQNKNEGYTVQPHMTLDLNFEEKGQQNDIPIEFKVDNPWSTGDKLLMNGQAGRVTVVPSPNKDDIKLVTITASCEYLVSFFVKLNGKIERQKNVEMLICPLYTKVEYYITRNKNSHLSRL